MRFVYLFFTLVTVSQVFGQSEFSLYRMNGNLPQSNLVNPAFAPNHKVVIGLPVISSIYGSVNTGGISFNNIFKNSETDSLRVDTLSLFSKLKPTQRMQFKESIQLFYFGLRGKRSYFSFGIHQVSETRLNYPGDLIGWAIRGPADQHYQGKPLDFGNFYGRSIAYNKVSVNYARDITPRLRVGARFNYLLGVAAGQSTKVSGSLTMSSDSVSINTGAIQAQTAGVDFFKQSNLGVSDYTNYFLHTKNKGMSWDFGGTYDLTENLTISAAVNDIGYINWKEYTHSYDVNPVRYTFKGFDLLDYLNQSSGQAFLQGQIDSVKNLVKASETKGGTFKTSLVGKFYGGINFRVLRVNNFSALVYFDMFHKRIDPAISLGYNLQLGRLLNTTLGITYQDGRINNIGAGIALKLLHMQVYATSDRANSFLYPARASRGDVHTGINFVFGKAKKKDKPADEKKKEEPKVEEEPKAEEKKPEPKIVEEKPDSVVQMNAPAALEPARQDTARVVPEEVHPELISNPVVTTQKPEPSPEFNQEPAAVPAKPVPAEPKHEIVKRGSHPDELGVAHYVIVGAFKSKENARRYSENLRNGGHENKFGFVTAKDLYYVYVFKTEEIETARITRDQFRKLSGFQLSESWVLTVEE